MELNFTPFTAQEANEATRAALKEQDEQLLKNFFDQIAARTTEGYYTLTIYKKLSKENAKFLIDYGYKIYETPIYCCSSSSEENYQVNTLITWSD